jgi:gag-polyprotein putative aspartyl protease
LPSLKGRHDGRKILLPVAILRSDNPTDLTHVRGTALLDTGATTSALSPQIIEQLNLQTFEKRPLIVATEDRLVDYYLFRIGFFIEGNPLPYVFAETDGFGMRTSNSFDVILGMDVLRQCDLNIGRSGSWELTFG